MIHLRIALLLLACAATAQAGDYTPLTKPQALEKLKTMVGEAASSGQKIELWLNVFGANQKCELVKSSDKFLSVKVMGNVFEQPWEKIAPEQLLSIGKSCAQENAGRALVLADLCFAFDSTAKADEALSLAAQHSSGSNEEIAARMKYLQSLGKGTKTETSSASTSTESTVSSESQPKPSGDAARWDAGLFTNGKLNLAAYEREGRDCSFAAIHRRLGPDYEYYHKGGKPEEVPTVYMPPTQSSGKLGRNGKGFSYQVGGPFDKVAENTYGSTCGQVFYVPDKPNDPGIDRIETYSWGGNCIMEKPEHVWWGGAHPDPSILRKDWLIAAGGALGQPYNMGRGHLLWSNDAIMLFNTGFVGTSGTQTSDDKFAHMLFPKNKIPTAVAVTNWNEFALVTIWDTQAGKGQVAVLALESLALAFHSWVYIGFPNTGSYSRIKVLGYIDLPGMATPTDICAGGNNHGGFMEGQKMLSTARLDTQEVRDSFYKGKNHELISSAGYATVISKHEGKIAFIDLQPLFEYFREMYLTTPENFAKTKDSGPDPKQWPFTFEVEPKMKPVVVATLSQPDPTCVLGGLRTHGKPTNVFVASQDGRIGIYQIGGLGNEQPASAEQIKCVNTVQVGRNPTMMQFLRARDPLVSDSSPYEMNTTFAVCCRGDREIDFVHVKGTAAEVYRKLKDSRLIDPVAIDFCERSYLVSVADFKGRKVINYRIGPVASDHFKPAKTVGCGPDGKDDLECGGFMDFPGYVYNINTSNVN